MSITCTSQLDVVTDITWDGNNICVYKSDGSMTNICIKEYEFTPPTPVTIMGCDFQMYRACNMQSDMLDQNIDIDVLKQWVLDGRPGAVI